ncbi:MAG: hypothetical protein M3P18_23930 [Actinomycetota bacterium]|nr:hypothetical protein [Actinomycetota bacterium]
MVKKPVLVLAILGAIFIAMVASGCGGPSAAQKQAKADAAQHARRLAAYRRCNAQLGPFLVALQDLGSRLDVGLSFGEYGNRVGNVKVAYDALSTGQLSYPCLSNVGVPAEAALKAYLTAYDTWNNCMSDEYCTTDSIDPDLQASWATARRKVGRAQAGVVLIREQ